MSGGERLLVGYGGNGGFDRGENRLFNGGFTSLADVQDDSISKFTTDGTKLNTRNNESESEFSPVKKQANQTSSNNLILPENVGKRLNILA